MADDRSDPALGAAEAVRAAEQAFAALPVRHVRDELTSEFAEAAERWERADEMFADAVPTTDRGALVKLYALIDLIRAAGSTESSLEMRHLRALIVFLEGRGGMAAGTVATDLPLHCC